MKHTWLALNVISIATLVMSGCGWVQSLRRDLDDDEPGRALASADYDYNDPRNRFTPPPPANVADSRMSQINGTPIDLSGIRAKNMRVKAQDFVNENARNENSLWSEEGQNNYLFAQNKLKMPGDLVTVVIEDQLRGEMVTSVKKLLPPEYRDADIRVPGLTKEARAEGDQRAPAAQGPAQGQAAKPDDEFEYTDIMTAEVLERYPNGNVRIRALKRVPFKRAVRNIEVVAIVKGADISEKDQVKSSKFFEQRVELYR